MQRPRLPPRGGQLVSPRTARRGIAAFLLGIALLVSLLLLAVPQARLTARTASLIPSFFVAIPQAPFNLFSQSPVHEVVELPAVDGYVRAHVYRPPAGRHPALVLSLGIDPAPPDDPRVVHLLQGLARSGLVAILVESEALDHDQLYPDLPKVLVEGVQYAETQPEVRADRVGLFGFSVGGSLALVAATRPEIRDRLRLVDAFGGYAELENALLSVATHTLADDGVIRPWQPDPVAEQHLANALIGGLGDTAESDLLRRRFVEHNGSNGSNESAQINPAALSPEARAVYELLTSRNRNAAEALLPALPAVAEQNFAALSPLPSLAQVRAKLFIMYDRDDPLLPFTGSRTLCRAARSEGLQPYCSNFAIFKHVDPTRGGNPVVVGHDLVELFWHAFAVLQALSLT